jgi:hypothetical protein
MYTTGLIFVKTGVMTGRYGRKCFLTYPESNFFRLWDSIRKHKYNNNKEKYKDEKIRILFGMEETYPQAFIDRVNSKNEKNSC